MGDAWPLADSLSDLCAEIGHPLAREARPLQLTTFGFSEKRSYEPVKSHRATCRILVGYGANPPGDTRLSLSLTGSVAARSRTASCWRSERFSAAGAIVRSNQMRRSSRATSATVPGTSGVYIRDRRFAAPAILCHRATRPRAVAAIAAPGPGANGPPAEAAPLGRMPADVDYRRNLRFTSAGRTNAGRDRGDCPRDAECAGRYCRQVAGRGRRHGRTVAAR